MSAQGKLQQAIDRAVAKDRGVAKIAPRARARALPRGEMNAGEARYAARLEQRKLSGEIADWRFDAVTLQLAPRTSLRMDFLVIERDGTLSFDDYKGTRRGKPHVEDDAMVKMKVAAKMYPWFRFRMVYEAGTKQSPIWSAVEIGAGFT